MKKKHHRAKLDFSQVKDMRNLYHQWKSAGSNKGYGELGSMFGCSQWTARDIVTYRTRVGA